MMVARLWRIALAIMRKRESIAARRINRVLLRRLDVSRRVQRTGTLRVLFAVAGHDPGERAEVGMLGVMVISGDSVTAYLTPVQ